MPDSITEITDYQISRLKTSKTEETIAVIPNGMKAHLRKKKKNNININISNNK